MDGQSLTPEEIRGRASESRLRQLLEAGPLPRWLVGVATTSNVEDAKGIDLFALLADGRRVPVQVKSSYGGVVKFVERGAESGVPWRRFAVVAVGERDSDRILLGRALRKIAYAAFGTETPAVSSHR